MKFSQTERKRWKEYTESLNDIDRGKLLIKLYTENDLTYKNLACVFNCGVEDILDYLKLVDIKK